MLANVLSLIALALSAGTFGLAQLFQRAAERRSRIPVLVFDYDYDSDKDRPWRIRNVGNGPALNIEVAIKSGKDDESWQAATRIPPIARDKEFRLTWLGDSPITEIAASYQDFLAVDVPGQVRNYTVHMRDDKNQIVPKRKRDQPEWSTSETEPHWKRQEEAAQSKQPA
jgi:hypothetical protein